MNIHVHIKAILPDMKGPVAKYSPICPAQQGHFYGQSPAKRPAQILVGKCEFTLAGLGMESKARQFNGTAGTMLVLKHAT